ncbi:MAG TPA: cysteine--tRNA ligase [Bacteroidales bacterium]|nr:cysteine--tRNA ligase [Bacteroidales bacterium]
MEHKLYIYNSINKKEELFEPINPPFVGLYVCGPTVYSETHLGHARPNITFDVLRRYLTHLGYKVRYVRNITDVGHLENEVEGSGEDRIGKKARLEQLEPMEVVQRYVNSFRYTMSQLNVLPPSIEPHASGHIIEQQLLVEKILENGFAYESNGSIYFDVEKYNKQYKYGKLSGRVLDELLENTRELEGAGEKKSSFDFALWKKASPEHIMKWPSKWSLGFPGWHLECSAMSTKYLGEKFDIHGGGMDLMFPHHECEIAQNVAASGEESVKYWMHNNMITINGQKMARSLGNFITLNELFTGTHKLLTQAYSPMTIRFFVLQAHYRSTLDFSNEALQAAEAGLQKLRAAMKILPNLKATGADDDTVKKLQEQCYAALNKDLNTAVLVAQLFDGVRLINSVNEGHKTISAADLDILKSIFQTFAIDILGLNEEANAASNQGLIDGIIKMLLQIRLDAKNNKDFATSDRIRNELTALGVVVKDRKDGFDWEVK